jgi:hypothetical protein
MFIVPLLYVNQSTGPRHLSCAEVLSISIVVVVVFNVGRTQRPMRVELFM